MALVISLLAALLLCGGLIAVLLWVKTPIYRVRRARVKQLLQWVLLGQATENDWRVFCDYPIAHDDLLEDIRQHCERIEEAYFTSEATYLFSHVGLDAVRRQLTRLECAPDEP